MSPHTQKITYTLKFVAVAAVSGGSAHHSVFIENNGKRKCQDFYKCNTFNNNNIIPGEATGRILNASF
jgi:hypothetical protein